MDGAAKRGWRRKQRPARGNERGSSRPLSQYFVRKTASASGSSRGAARTKVDNVCALQQSVANGAQLLAEPTGLAARDVAVRAALGGRYASATVFLGCIACEGCATGCWRCSPAVRQGWPLHPSWRSPRASMSVATAKWFAPAILAATALIAGACRPSPAGCAASFPPAVLSTVRNASASACAAPGAAEAHRPRHVPGTARRADPCDRVATAV